MNAAAAFAAGTVARYGARVGAKALVKGTMKFAKARSKSGRGSKFGKLVSKIKKQKTSNVLARHDDQLRSITAVVRGMDDTHCLPRQLGSFNVNRQFNESNFAGFIASGDNPWNRTGDTITLTRFRVDYTFQYTGDTAGSGGKVYLHMFLVKQFREYNLATRWYQPQIASSVPLDFSSIGTDQASDNVRDRLLLNTKEFKILKYKKVVVGPNSYADGVQPYRTGKFNVPMNQKVKYTPADHTVIPATPETIFPRLRFVFYLCNPDINTTELNTKATVSLNSRVYFKP